MTFVVADHRAPGFLGPGILSPTGSIRGTAARWSDAGDSDLWFPGGQPLVTQYDHGWKVIPSIPSLGDVAEYEKLRARISFSPLIDAVQVTAIVRSPL